MLKLTLLVLPVGLVLFAGSGRFAGANDASPDALSSSLTMVPLPGAGCRHTLKVRNDGALTVKINWYNSAVRTQVGFWKQLYGGGPGIFYVPPSSPNFPVASGKSHSWIYTTDFGCNANRRWRFELNRSDGKESMLYYPSSSSFSENTTVDLGNVGRSSLW